MRLLICWQLQCLLCLSPKCVWLSPLEWAKVKCKYANQKAIWDFLFVGNSSVCLFVTIYEIIIYAFPNVLDSTLWPWKWWSSTLTIWMKKGVRTYLVNTHMCVDEWTDRWSLILLAKITPFKAVWVVQKGWIYLKPFFCCPPTRHTHRHTHICGHTHTTLIH